jgi:hypothetical protein
MIHHAPFANGRHLVAARIMAGFKQTGLAELAGFHVNSPKRLERMARIKGSPHSTTAFAEALKAKGILIQCNPGPAIRQQR